MGTLIGLSREWVSKLERGKEEASERVRLKVDKIERERGIHIIEADFTAAERLKAGGKPAAVVQEEQARFGQVASRITQQRAPSTRQDCEDYARQLFDAAELSEDPNAWPVIHDRLKKKFPLDEWESVPKPE